jgi:hypothetical protein
MNNIVDLIGGGIKCDNPKCNYADETVKIEDYKKWLNKPCPCCGSSLLTKADYNNVRLLVWLANTINKTCSNSETAQDNLENEQSTIVFHMNGTGDMDIELN